MTWEQQENFWRQALSKLKTWKRGDQRAVHKPLLTLMLIAKAASDNSRHIHFVTIVEELTKLLQEFGPRRLSYHPELPFWHLQADGFWEVESRANFPLKKSGQSPTKQTLLAQDAVGAVPHPLWEVLQRNAGLRAELTQQLLDAFWPPTMHDAIRQAIGRAPHMLRSLDLRSAGEHMAFWWVNHRQTHTEEIEGGTSGRPSTTRMGPGTRPTSTSPGLARLT